MGSALRLVVARRQLLLLDPSEYEDLRRYKEKVKASHQPFSIHVSTLAGAEAHVEVSHEDSVWSLRTKVTAELKQGSPAYRTRLTNQRGKLENDSAALRDCLLCSSQGEEVVATYEKADRWVELSHAEFEEFRRKESNEAARLHRAVREAEMKAGLYKSESNKM